ncbi:DUF5134 domain-containing protein [Microlunatus parietis]|uniref:DUF5134 domain-containing protein n=1 Tax=Microlunatus parietis TaxID=682979 RepID=A0A7Y9IF38_9ACTN|nr:DUF5134 domain-containing protein [Microlunatus parietis]NYE75049.1 hypothetical protein [Microlunatus parietis]
MIDAWAITVISVAVAAYGVLRLLRPWGCAGRTGVISQLLHVIMAVAMIAMVWLPQPAWSGWLQLTGFALAGVWYLLPRVRCSGDRETWPTHAVMMFGMSWMSLVMIIRPPGPIASLAGIAVLVAFLAVGSRQAVALAGPLVRRHGRRVADRSATVAMVLGMIIMTVPMLAVST